MFPEPNLPMGPAEQRVMRSFRIKFGLILLAVLALAGYFLWRDLSQGHYVRVVLLLLVSFTGAMRSTRGFKRYRVGKR